MLEDVTIGMPVFNEEAFIAQAIESALQQDVARIIIADNASDDGTSEICAQYAHRFNQIIYTRHHDNMGSLANFAYCLDQADTSCFMWLGAHDYLEADYCERLSETLSREADASMAFAPVSYVDSGGNFIRKHEYRELKWGVSSSVVNDRVQNIICDICDWTLVHGLFKTEILRSCIYRKPVRGPDSIVLARAALCGRLLCCDDTTYWRRTIRNHSNDDQRMEMIAGKKGCEYSGKEMCNVLFEVILQTRVPEALRRIRFLYQCIIFMRKTYDWTPSSLRDLLMYLLKGERAVTSFGDQPA